VLSESDAFGLVTFARTAMAFQPAMVSGTREWRDKAHAFLIQVESGGGTELATGFHEAAKLLEGVGGDILIFTDGEVSGTEKILADARSAGVRLHCLGIGSASQDRFLALLARETGGVSRFVTPRARVDLSAVDLFAFIGRPVASGLKAGANVKLLGMRRPFTLAILTAMLTTAAELNHFYRVIDHETYSAIEGSDFLKSEFAAFEKRRVPPCQLSWLLTPTCHYFPGEGEL
jgi:von Willebrand factor type A domain